MIRSLDFALSLILPISVSIDMVHSEFNGQETHDNLDEPECVGTDPISNIATLLVIIIQFERPTQMKQSQVNQILILIINYGRIFAGIWKQTYA